jgi:hypothetical protein
MAWPVPQVLFSLVLNANPSRNAGRTRAVDSVSYVEALEFCRRLGWVLGTAVRLPPAQPASAAAASTARQVVVICRFMVILLRFNA